MTAGPYIAEIGALVGDPGRATMLDALMGGQALTATELANLAGVTPQTASGHLAKLVEGRLLSVVASGRRRYFALASPRVAQMLEGLMLLAADGPPRHRPRSIRDEELAAARTCYDHFAGRLGVALADALAARGHVVLGADGGLVTDAGRAALCAFGLDLEDAARRRRAFCRPCLDWSERRWHIGGSVGAALADRCYQLGWTVRAKDGRAVRVTTAGATGLREAFGIAV